METNPVSTASVNPTQPASQALLFWKPEERPTRSESIEKIALALAQAQGEIENADKDGKGTYGKYATLASTWEAIRGPLTKNGLSVYQRILTISGKPTMCTMLLHTSGEFFDDCEVELKFDGNGNRMTPMQAMGSAITYARRYSLQAVAGVAPADDDDGVGAGHPSNEKPAGGASAKADTASKAPAKTAAPASNESKKIETPPKPATPANHAPASAEMLNQIIGLCMDRGIPEPELNLVLRNGYAHEGVAPVWIAKEVITELSKPDTTSETFAKFGELVKARREAAHLRKQAQQQTPPPTN